ncbi:hypothetical protein [Polyangium aurulentum]|uniref:hypothetical protein n=1 Tax=Polyangium aurulentum TaxID=2567896 RepID=UPI0010AEAF2E|nr:hypothetical protein [Polyangium aurulentum]UQA62240.1 hypothetical protein E8A73_017920 [Polyangium aurulentum]
MRGWAAWIGTTVALVAAPAQAQVAVATEPSAEERAREKENEASALVNLVRYGGSGLYFRGTRLIGYGSRKPYHGVSGGLDIAGAFFLVKSAPWFGFEIGLRFGAVLLDDDDGPDGALESALLAAPARWHGALPGSFVLGLGGGVSRPRPAWLSAGVGAYPLALARLRLWPSRVVSLHAQWRFTPVTTDLIDDLFVQNHEVEVAVGWKALQVAARCRIDEVKGGDPERTYRGLGCGPFVGMALYW